MNILDKCENYINSKVRWYRTIMAAAVIALIVAHILA